MKNTYLVAADNSDGSQRALAHAIERAKASGAGLVLVHVIDWSPYSFHTNEELAQRHQRREEEIVRAKEAIVQPLALKAESEGITVESHVRHGRGAETLAAMAQEFDVAQIIAGRSGETGLKSIVFGSTASKLIQISDVPVLVVP